MEEGQRIARLLVKLPWKDGIYPHSEKGLYYRTRQLIFVDESTGRPLRVNVQSRRPNSMLFNKLKVGMRIREFRVLRDMPDVIDPESPFAPHSDAALF